MDRLTSAKQSTNPSLKEQLVTHQHRDIGSGFLKEIICHVFTNILLQAAIFIQLS
jgi:hypothetical protein